MFATHQAAEKSKAAPLGQKGPAEQIEHHPEEGPFESFLAVVQDMWGPGNLSPLDDVFASAAIGALAVTNAGIFGAVCYQLGNRLFSFSREVDTWIDAYECEPTVSHMRKRLKDKIKLSRWAADGHQLGKCRFTKLAVLQACKIPGSFADLTCDYANALKQKGNLFLASLVAGKAKSAEASPMHFGDLELRSLDDHKAALTQAGLALCSEYDLSTDVRGGILRGLYNSINMLTHIRTLKEPGKGQRLAAFYRELETLSRLYRGLETGDVAAAGILAVKP